MVTDGVEGILVPPGEWISLANAIEKLATSPDLRAEMGRAARARAEAAFGQELVVEQTMRLYHQVLEDA